MNMIIPRRTQVGRRWIGLVMALVTAGVAVLNPAPGLAATAEAAAVACRLAPRLHVGDAVTLVKGQPNRIRQAPGLAAARTAFRISAGEVWYVLAGPVCQDGMNWFQVGQGDAVGWTSEGTPAEGYYLGRATSPVAGNTAGVCKANYATRLAVGMEVSVGDGVQQRIRPQPRKSAAAVAWLAPGQAVTIVGGPTCADGWIWWQIANSMGRTLGWTSEGDENGYWLFAGAKAAAPKLAGTYEPSADSTLVVNFNSENEAANVIFDSLGAAPLRSPTPTRPARVAHCDSRSPAQAEGRSPMYPSWAQSPATRAVEPSRTAQSAANASGSHAMPRIPPTGTWLKRSRFGCRPTHHW